MNVYLRLLALFAFAILVPSLPARADNAGSDFSIRVPQLAVAPNVSGTIDDSWNAAARINLAWDYNYRKPAEEATTVYVAQSGQALYIAWDVHQRTPLTINQNTNGSGVYNDDHVGVVFTRKASRDSPISSGLIRSERAIKTRARTAPTHPSGNRVDGVRPTATLLPCEFR